MANFISGTLERRRSAGEGVSARSMEQTAQPVENPGSNIEGVSGNLENSLLPAVELNALPGMEKVPNSTELTTRSDVGKYIRQLDYVQGDSETGIANNCGLVSIRNMNVLCGRRPFSEAFISEYAVKNGLCYSDARKPRSEWGGTSSASRQELLKRFGIQTELWRSGAGEVTPERLAEALDQGRRGIMSLNAGILWNNTRALSFDAEGKPCSNHVVTLLGAVRDKDGQVTGFLICDSGAAQKAPCQYVSKEKLFSSFTNVRNAVIHVTERPERGG